MSGTAIRGAEQSLRGPLIYRCAEVRAGYGRGWSFTPLRGKVPYLRGWQRRPRETVEQALMWAQQRNVGLRTGRMSGVLVFDIDLPILPVEFEGLVTPTVRTGSGRYHLYFTMCPWHAGCPALCLPSSGHCGELKGNGGQVVFVGSIHPNTGAMYDWVQGRSPDDVPLAEAPSWVFRPPRKATPKPGRRLTDARHVGNTVLYAAAQTYIAKVPGAREGSRHPAAVALAAHLAGFETEGSRERLNRDQIRSLLGAWNARNDPPLPLDELDDIVGWLMKGGSGRAAPQHLVRQAGKGRSRVQEIRESRRRRLADRRQQRWEEAS